MRLCSLRASITQTPVCCTKQKKSEFTAIYGNYVIKSDVAATAMPSLWMKLPCDVKRVTLFPTNTSITQGSFGGMGIAGRSSDNSRIILFPFVMCVVRIIVS